jgi:hypothetical protein
MSATNVWPLLGGVILVLVAAYFGFQAIDGTGLPLESGSAIITGKEHKPPGKSYRTEIIGGRTQVIPQYTGDMYILKLRLGDTDTARAVDQSLFDSVRNGDRVAITYQKRRLTGGLQVAAVQLEGR